MKRILSLILALILLISVFSLTAYAGGDKLRGEKGAGSVTQVQIQDPPPFQ